MKKIIGFLINLFFSFFKVNDNKIVFESGHNKADGNPLAIYLYIKKNCHDKLKCIWLVSKKTDISVLDKKDVRYYNTLGAWFNQATAKYWIKSQSSSSVINKRKNQIYLQCEHSNGVFKKCGYDVTGVNPGYPAPFTKEWTYFVASDRRLAAEIKSSTGYNGKYETIGLARSDIIINRTPELISSIKAKLKIDNKYKKIVLYAPTFREKDLTNYTDELPIDEFAKLKDYLFIIKLHPQAKGVNPNIKIPENVLDLSYYNDTQDILLISDLLISDYSTIVWDFTLMHRPTIYYMYDLEEYLKERGGFDIDINNELPGPIAYNKKELIKYIKDDSWYKDYEEKIDYANKEFNYLNDGHVCERIVEKILSGYFKE